MDVVDTICQLLEGVSRLFNLGLGENKFCHFERDSAESDYIIQVNLSTHFREVLKNDPALFLNDDIRLPPVLPAMKRLLQVVNSVMVKNVDQPLFVRLNQRAFLRQAKLV